ncbi:MAG: hypothetical protein HY331_18235 [Chloroflexi bacterium]|nr:hypothetical protein [Chloroflexota bacterium]
MARRWKKPISDQTATRLKEPVNPSVRGTGEQSGREAKGVKHAPSRAEGAGHSPGGGGRGGKVAD